MQSDKINIETADDSQTLEMLYHKYSSKMYGICLRFAGNTMEADDILQEGFIKVYTKLKYFRNEGSLEGWIRRIFVNTAINYYRKKSRYAFNEDLEDVHFNRAKTGSSYSDLLSKEELVNLIQSLPNGYRTVFNLNVVEGYTHKEIGEMLGISDNTSKSQLTRAKTILKKKVLSLMKEKVKVPFNDFRVIRNDTMSLKQEELQKAV